MAAMLLFLLFAILGSTNADWSCKITNVEGEVTDLSGVKPFIWHEAVGSPFKYIWYLSLCKEHKGICNATEPRSTFPAYIQTAAPANWAPGRKGGCEKNAWFKKWTGGSGGQGSSISLQYDGNPVLNPPVSRAATVSIDCNPNGSYDEIDQCTTTVNRVGDVFQYVFSCTSKIACAGAPPNPPPPAPSPVPPPPPATCSCVLLWWNDDNCTHTSETSARAMGGQCNDFRPPFSKGLSVRLNSKCEYLQAFNSTTCGRPSISQVTHTNKCVPFSTGGSIMVACDNN
eukprot:TRINITY_DN67164_c6_g1_i8.p1 TRINITY_DN67164_c6_g1~~TRINITY_DN67164_c6_g1_i8.p1  ORF type:complete len:285 (-),score=49.91 TRINITY_DN67164_c6_g1_i8:17-871(-)